MVYNVMYQEGELKEARMLRWRRFQSELMVSKLLKFYMMRLATYFVTA
jgi:hypothetical protein